LHAARICAVARRLRLSLFPYCPGPNRFQVCTWLRQTGVMYSCQRGRRHPEGIK
jgi:hypothetical protein